MLDLFDYNPHATIRQLFTVPKMQYYADAHKRNTDLFFKYYNSRERVVENNHIFSRLLKTLMISLDSEWFEWYKHVDVNAKYISRDFKIVSDISKGKIHSNIFYRNSREILLYQEPIEHPYYIPQTWKEICPIKIIYSPEYVLDYYMFDGSKVSEPGISVYSIDVVSMVLQYREWALDRLQRDRSTDVNEYIATLLLPSIQRSYFDIAIFNRYLHLVEDRPMSQYLKTQHPFYLSDYTDKIDQQLKIAVRRLDNISASYYEYLNAIPSLTGESILTSLQLPNSLVTRQSEWVIWMARLDYIYTLIKCSGPKTLARNKDLINSLRFELRYLRNRSTDLYDHLSNELYSKIEYLESIVS